MAYDWHVPGVAHERRTGGPTRRLETVPESTTGRSSMKRCTGRALIAVIAIVLLLGAIGAGVLFSVRKDAIAPTDLNVLLISIDTCRPDRLSCYGYPRKTTPNIDALADSGLRFVTAIAPATVTLPSHSSMLTGTTPPYHGVHSNMSTRLRKSNVTLAEVLKEHGYATGGMISGFPLDQQFGIAQGFDTYDSQLEQRESRDSVDNERDAQAVTAVARAWLREHVDERFFLFVHYFDAHFPYVPPEPYATTYADDLYAGEVAFVDHHIGQLLGELERLGSRESTLVVVTSDHGESLGEHGEKTHGYFIYHATTKVPLIFHVPGRTQSRVIDEKAALIDIFPTILDLVGIPVPDQVNGRSLASFFNSSTKRLGKRAIFSESLMPTAFGCSSLLALETEEWKYIQSTRPELYNLRQDPNEMTDVIASHPDTARALQGQLKAMLKSQLRTNDRDVSVALDAEALRRLEALGYVGGEVNETYDFETDKEDPKDFFHGFQKLGTATVMMVRSPLKPAPFITESGEVIMLTGCQAVKRVCEEVLAERPDTPRAYGLLARAAMKEKDYVAAEKHFSNLLRLQPQSAVAIHGLGKLFALNKRYGKARYYYQKILDLAANVEKKDSMDGALKQLASGAADLINAYTGLADVCFRQNDMEGALTHSIKALEVNPRRVASQYRVGAAYSFLGKYKEAIPFFRKALELSPGYGPAEKGLRQALAKTGAPPSP